VIPVTTNALLTKIETSVVDDYGNASGATTRWEGESRCFVDERSLRAQDGTLVRETDLTIDSITGEPETGDELTYTFAGREWRRTVNDVKPYALDTDDVLGYRVYLEQD
jgi:hypothetical protein